MRDKNLDAYRGIVMIYIVCVIHGVCWLGYEQEVEPVFSFLLFEMPLIFFISGASLSLSRPKCSIWDSLKNRFIRVMLPYYVYACVSMIMITIFSFLYVDGFDIRQYTLGNILRIILSIDIPQMPFVAHLWFIIPYMCLLSTFCVQKRLIDKYGWRYYFCCCIILFVLCVSISETPDVIRNVLGYNIFLLAGYKMYRRMSWKKMCYIFVGCITVVIMLLYFGVPFHSMQMHKFPPDVMFVAYGGSVVCLLALLLWKVNIPESGIVRIWNDRGFTIYLYQNIVFFIFTTIRGYFNILIPYMFVNMIVGMVSVFVLSTSLTYATCPIEKFVIRKLMSK